MDDAGAAADGDDGERRCGREGGADEVEVAREGEGEGEDGTNCFWRLADVFCLLLVVFKKEPLDLR